MTTFRVTIACPEAHVADANDLAQVLGFTEADGQTYGPPWYLDAKGSRYACPSLIVSPAFANDAFLPLERPKWDSGRVVNMTGAARAQLLIRVSTPEAPLTASPDAIVAVFSDATKPNAHEMRRALGLRPE